MVQIQNGRVYILEKAALILEGGALRSFFTSSILDYFLEHDVEFEYVHGVSAGTLCAMNYISKQRNRSSNINLHFLHDKRYISVSNLWNNGGIFNLDFLFSPDCFAYSPFDWDAYRHSQQIFEITATNCETGEAQIFRKQADNDQVEAIKASSSIPLLSDIRLIDGQHYLDGGIADSIPFKRAQELGYDKIVVVVTRDLGYRKPENGAAMNNMIKRRYKQYPNFVQAFIDRPKHYNQSLNELEKLEKEGKIFVLRPAAPVTVSHFERDDSKLIDLYHKGTETIVEQMPALKKYLTK